MCSCPCVAFHGTPCHVTCLRPVSTRLQQAVKEVCCLCVALAVSICLAASWVPKHASLTHTSVLCLALCLSVSMAVRKIDMQVCVSVSLSLSVYLFACLPACLPACLHVCLPVCLFVCLPACLPVCLLVRLSLCLSDCLSVHPPDKMPKGAFV